MTILAFISAQVHPDLRHLIEPEAELSALGLDELARVELAQHIDETTMGEWVSDGELAGWQTVRDVLASFERRRIAA